ncbi:MAG: Peptidyl-tRNA hydrolase [Chlamydiae bacterium]|nr:Peptidyl-tRNA hydrolase [Chlamydiota bacterium]
MKVIEERPVKLIVGLGNPGSRYAYTRHNLGFLVLDELAKGWGTSFKAVSRFEGDFAKVDGDSSVYLLKPSTFMNLSGLAVKKCMQFYKVKKENLLVISDDADLDFGIMKLKPKGGSGGHRGLKHIQSHLGPDYSRLKMGIGSPKREALEDYVLEKFTEKEMSELGAFVGDAEDIVKLWVLEGLEAAMNRANTKNSEN